MNLQVPPNLSQDEYGFFLLAGINDWGGISPGDARFHQSGDGLAGDCRSAAVTGKPDSSCAKDSAAYPEYLRDSRWMPENLRRQALVWMDDAGLVRREQEAA